jgi:hypothetical protein
MRPHVSATASTTPCCRATGVLGGCSGKGPRSLATPPPPAASGCRNCFSPFSLVCHIEQSRIRKNAPAPEAGTKHAPVERSGKPAECCGEKDARSQGSWVRRWGRKATSASLGGAATGGPTCWGCACPWSLAACQAPTPAQADASVWPTS